MRRVQFKDVVRKTVSLPNALWGKIEKEADTLRMTQAEFVRSVLEIYFREKEND